MIPLHELRLGNIINDFENGVFPIEEIRQPSEGFKSPYVVYRNGGSKAVIDESIFIPLTPEWLERFGFEKSPISWIGRVFQLTEWDVYPLNWCVAMNKNNAVLVEKLKYVHQLQNLYFCLCGQELELKG